MKLTQLLKKLPFVIPVPFIMGDRQRRILINCNNWYKTMVIQKMEHLKKILSISRKSDINMVCSKCLKISLKW